MEYLYSQTGQVLHHPIMDPDEASPSEEQEDDEDDEGVADLDAQDDVPVASLEDDDNLTKVPLRPFYINPKFLFYIYNFVSFP